MKVMSWDGSAWTDVSPSPAVRGDLRNVFMASAAEGIAVGHWYDNNTQKHYMKTLTWDGSSWTAATIPNGDVLEDVAMGPSFNPTPTPTPSPTATPTETPTQAVTPTPSSTPTPTETPTPAVTPTPTLPPMTLWINFQKPSSVVPAGHMADTGGPYDPLAGYGWY